MALIKKDKIIKNEKDKYKVHEEVQAGYSIFTSNGEKYFQIETYGSSDRKIPGKVSQSLQFDEGSIKELIRIFNNCFDVNTELIGTEKTFIKVGAETEDYSEFDSFIEEGYAGIGWNGIGNLSEIVEQSENPKESIAELLGRLYYSDKTEKARKSLSSEKAGEILKFFYSKAFENYVVALKGQKILAIGHIIGDYFYDTSKSFGHCKPVKWIKVFSDEQILLPEKEGHLRTCCDITKQSNIEFLNSLIDYQYAEYIIENKEFRRNMIIHGAPGTGKSYHVEKLLKKLLAEKGEYTRVTFHPDYSYAGFVGTYKPVPVGNDSTQGISYEYVPGPFMHILVKALQNPNKPYLLIIEEINRSNTAAVFGDVFQLLDRDNTGKSMYPINVSPDMKAYLKKETGIDFSEIRIPSNMFIWATMNSADQGVFPMDTAFKRRWSFSYIGLDDSESEMEKYNVKLGSETVNWNKLRKALNDRLTDLGINEDKLFGPFFISEADMKNQEEFSDIFKDKVISYLFEDAARGKRKYLFDVQKMRYSKICRELDKRGTGIFNFEGMSVDFAPVNTVTGSDNE